MEVTDEPRSDEDSKVSGMMHLLISGDFESKDRLYATLADMYSNFTTIYKAVIGLLDDLNSKLPEYDQVHSRLIRVLTMFCWCLLNRIIEEDGITIRKRHARLLSEIELYLLYPIQYYNTELSEMSIYSPPFRLSKRDRVRSEIRDVYFEIDLPVCYHLINYDSVLELLNHILAEFNNFFDNDWKDEFIFYRSYLEFLVKDGFHGDNLEKLLITIEHAVCELTCYSFHGSSLGNEKSMLSRVSSGVFRDLVLQSHGFFSASLMHDELLKGYLGCVVENYNKLTRKKSGFDQLKVLYNGFEFLFHLLETYLPRQDSELEILTNSRLDFQDLVKNIGSVICSCPEYHETEEMNLRLFDLIKKSDVIRGDIIKTICCVVLQKTEQESPRNDQLGSLILLLQNLKVLADRKPSMILNWRNHENLVLFIFYLIHNNIGGGNRIDDDEFSQNILHQDMALINHEELNGVLISAQVVAFCMACESLLRKHERFHWWELYFGDSDYDTLHFRVGILKALVYLIDESSKFPLTDKMVIAYIELVQDSLIELAKYTSSSLVKDQIKFLREGVMCLVRLLISYKHEQEKLSHVEVCFQDLVANIGSVICSCFTHWMKDRMATGQGIELSGSVEKLNFIFVEIWEFIHLIILNKIGRESPKNDHLGSLNLLLENWKGLMECESNLIITWKDQFHMIYTNLVLFRSFIESSGTGDDESQNLCRLIVDAGHVAEYLLSSFSIGACPIRGISLWISELTEQVERIKADVMQVNKKMGNAKDIGTAGKEPSRVSAQALLGPLSTDVVVGFNKEVNLIKEKLSSDHGKLDVISIIGMPGLGKTTMARRVYDDPFIVNHFQVRAWCTVSQVYDKKELYFVILASTIEITDKIKKMNEIDLSTMVHQELMGRRYLIVLDDIWSINAFMELSIFFPACNQGSRIMLTSRIKVTGEHTKLHSAPIEPVLLTNDECWELLERKVYGGGKCCSELRQVGKEIAMKCRGLPLTVVVVAGILANLTKKREFWEQVAGNLSSYRDSPSHIMDALELSYKYLPEYLKPMFLYLGAFPEDANIPANKIMHLWMAEGFVQKMESTSLESQAEKKLMDLIDRSLVMVAEKRWDGRVKVCHVHDLLHDMCIQRVTIFCNVSKTTQYIT